MKSFDALSDDELARLVPRAAELPDAPPELVRAAIALWPASRAPKPSLQDVGRSAWRLVTATLSFDSWATPALACGMRAGRSETRHLLFTTRGRDIDVRISPIAGSFCVSGQILGPDASGSVELVTQVDDGEGATRAVPLDPLGEFRLDGVPGGTYRMRLLTGSDEIVLPSIVVGVPPS